MSSVEKPRCRLLCDVALDAIAKGLGITFSPREKDLAKHVLAGTKIRDLPLLLGDVSNGGTAEERRSALSAVRGELRVIYRKAGGGRREKFTADCWEQYRLWRNTDPPKPCTKLCS